jgi:hypothetical protein
MWYIVSHIVPFFLAFWFETYYYESVSKEQHIRLRMSDNMKENVQVVADKWFDGNISLTMRFLIRKGLMLWNSENESNSESFSTDK